MMQQGRIILFLICQILSHASAQTDPRTCLPQLDIAFAVDSSSSVGTFYFQYLLKLLKEVAAQLNVYETGVRISLVKFSDRAWVEFYLDQAQSEEDISHLLDNVVYVQGNTHTGAALKLMRESVFTAQHGDRPDVPNLAIVVTDGSSNDHNLLVTESSQVHQGGITVFAVSVGYLTDPNELSLMAGDHVFRVHSFMDLPSHARTILNTACKVFNPQTPVTTTTSTAPPTSVTSALHSTTTGGHQTSKTFFTDLTPSSTASLAPHAISTIAPCLARYADVVMVIDSSNSVGPDHFTDIQVFMTSLVDSLDVSPGRVRFGVIQFSDDAKEVIKLGNITTRDQLRNAILNMKYTGGGTNTANALQLLASQVFATPRSHVPQVGVVMTDGLSRQMILTRLQANLLHHMGVHMFAIGVGSHVSRLELEMIARQSSHQTVFTVSDYATLHHIQSQFAVSACDVLSDHRDSVNATPPSDLHNSSLTDLLTGECYDHHPHCQSYGQDMCSDYEHWARENCALTCQFCVSNDTSNYSSCIDRLSNCQAYGTYYCHDPKYFPWVQQNCARHCGLCHNDTENFLNPSLETTTDVPVEKTSTSTTVHTTSLEPSECRDTIPDCDNYGGPSVCQQFRSWASVRCRAYCQFCVQYVTTNATTVDGTRCPQWKLPVDCTLEVQNNSCCPMPRCPNGCVLTVTRHD